MSESKQIHQPTQNHQSEHKHPQCDFCKMDCSQRIYIQNPSDSYTMYQNHLRYCTLCKHPTCIMMLNVFGICPKCLNKTISAETMNERMKHLHNSNLGWRKYFSMLHEKIEDNIERFMNN